MGILGTRQPARRGVRPAGRPFAHRRAATQGRFGSTAAAVASMEQRAVEEASDSEASSADEAPATAIVRGCSCGHVFISRGEMDLHVVGCRNAYPELEYRYPCPEVGCASAFKHKRSLRLHCHGKHPESTAKIGKVRLAAMPPAKRANSESGVDYTGPDSILMRDLKPGQLVWYKFREYPFWPAVVDSVVINSDNTEHNNDAVVHIAFFGDSTYEQVRHPKLRLRLFRCREHHDYVASGTAASSRTHILFRAGIEQALVAERQQQKEAAAENEKESQGEDSEGRESGQRADGGAGSVGKETGDQRGGVTASQGAVGEPEEGPEDALTEKQRDGPEQQEPEDEQAETHNSQHGEEQGHAERGVLAEQSDSGSTASEEQLLNSTSSCFRDEVTGQFLVDGIVITSSMPSEPAATGASSLSPGAHDSEGRMRAFTRTTTHVSPAPASLAATAAPPAPSGPVVAGKHPNPAPRETSTSSPSPSRKQSFAHKKKAKSWLLSEAAATREAGSPNSAADAATTMASSAAAELPDVAAAASSPAAWQPAAVAAKEKLLRYRRGLVQFLTVRTQRAFYFPSTRRNGELIRACIVGYEGTKDMFKVLCAPTQILLCIPPLVHIHVPGIPKCCFWTRVNCLASPVAASHWSSTHPDSRGLPVGARCTIPLTSVATTWGACIGCLRGWQFARIEP